ncbi:UNVERIFIED_CONTAM: hypothetical protein Slati_2238100 [Sesamum latifolium]|uniref:Uncharacterized protein n=1 Tax=Sesamum latifolium TaxID=2727402 RepID=A0AAW2WW51_9LAMI
MAPYEALYGRKCRSPLHWDLDDQKQSRVDNREKMLQPELVQEAIDKVHLICQRIQTAQARQKSYADNQRRDLEFSVGDKVFLKVYSRKGITRFGKRNELKPRRDPFVSLIKIQELRNRRIPLVKVLWRNHGVEEATWKREDELHRNHPGLFNESTDTG